MVRLDLAYDGTDFRGWARQRGQRTVQGEVERALERVLGHVPALTAAGRTDAGVHARGQVVSFPAPARSEPEKLQRAINAMLAPEVVVHRARWAPAGFDARFSATSRQYRYRIDTAPWPDPFVARFVWHRAGGLALKPMRTAARALVGTHDFASFCRSPQRGTTVRTVTTLSVASSGTVVTVTAEADAFLHQMVRSLVGTLVDVGEGRIDPHSMPEVLSARSRGAAGRVAPAHGLVLERVRYGRRARP